MRNDVIELRCSLTPAHGTDGVRGHEQPTQHAEALVACVALVRVPTIERRLPWADGGVGCTVAIVDGVGPTQRASALLMSGGRHVDILRRDGVGFGVVNSLAEAPGDVRDLEDRRVILDDDASHFMEGFFEGTHPRFDDGELR